MNVGEFLWLFIPIKHYLLILGIQLKNCKMIGVSGGPVNDTPCRPERHILSIFDLAKWCRSKVG